MVLYVALISVLLVPLILVLIWYYKYYQFEKYLKHFPGVKPLPLIGNALDFQNSTKMLPEMMRYLRICKGNFKIYISSQPYLFLSKPAEVECLLSSNVIISKSLPYSYLHNWLGTGLLTATGTKWRRHRKMITPAFFFQILEDFVDIFNAASTVLIRKLEKEVENNYIDIYPYINLCSLDMICESTMGTSVNAQENSNSDYVRSVHTMLMIIVKRAFSPLNQYDFFYRFSSMHREEKAALEILHDYSKSVISRRRAEFLERSKNGRDQIATDELGRKRKRAFLDLLLESSIEGQMLTDEELREEVDTFMFEGHDTIGTSISFLLFCLANHQNVQRKVCEEIKQIFSDDSTRQCTYRDLQDMKYLDMVIKESLRMYPPVPFYGRQITEDTELNGKILPKGLMVNVFNYGLHYDPEIFSNPETFDPERFSTDKMKNKNPYTYLPFSAGPRNCIGQKFAVAEIKTVASNLLRHFHLLPVLPEHKPILNSEVVLRSANGLPIQLQKRILDERQGPI